MLSIIFKIFIVFSFFSFGLMIVSDFFQCVGKRKRKRSGEDEEEEKTREVVHVRAKRGQATDSHSLAERVIYI